jgi:hypothetical protein
MPARLLKVVDRLRQVGQFFVAFDRSKYVVGDHVHVEGRANHAANRIL